MKKWFGKLLPSFLTCLVGIAAVLTGITYFNFISQKIYNDSTGHLEEIYGQVNRSFGAFVERNWELLESWGNCFNLVQEMADPEISQDDALCDFITKEQECWGFTEFYFLSRDGSCMTLSGSKDHMDLGDAWDSLISQGEPVMSSETLASGQNIILFASSVPEGTYRDFSFGAVAVSYTNADIASSLNVDAFSGNARCFVIHSDGIVLLSTQTGGSVFDNYLVYLRAASDLGSADLDQLQNDWLNGKSGLLQCRIGNVSYCILYQPVGYQDYILLSAVPQNIISAGFLSVQKTTIAVFIVIFLLVGTMVAAPIIRNIRRQSQKSRMEVRYREIMFDVLSNSVDDIFMMLDSVNYSVEYISPNTERLLGIPLQAASEDIRIVGKCAVGGDIMFPKAELEAIPLQGSRYWECEYMHQKTGERRWYRMTVYRMDIQNVIKYIIVLSDRTQEQQMNQKLQEALTAARSANEAKSNFLSNMSHDIRTPMNAIVGFSMLLEKDADDAAKVREYTRKITAASHHLLSLINDVLDMSKIESGKTSLNVDCFNLPELLDELNIILMPQAKAKNQTFEIHVQGTPPEQLVGDRLRLNQILINLLSNAVKYTPSGGRIQFQVSEIEQPSAQYARLRFSVQDNGIGMSAEFQKHIFAPFSREISSVTNKIQGTGLGMAITKNLVDLMGGIIQVESEPGCGSTFTVELSFLLPRQEESAPLRHQQVTQTPAVNDEDSVMKGLRFLVAEDNELNAEILTEILDMEGAVCELAANGLEAVEMFKKSEPGYYDMILMDVQMPVMNGYEATRQIRACGHLEAGTIPIAAMTANTFAEDVRDAMEAGMDGHLAKPIDMDAVKEMVGRLLKQKGGEIK